MYDAIGFRYIRKYIFHMYVCFCGRLVLYKWIVIVAIFWAYALALQLLRATVQNAATGENEPATYRISKRCHLMHDSDIFWNIESIVRLQIDFFALSSFNKNSV